MKKKIFYLIATSLIIGAIVVYAGYSLIFPFEYNDAPVNKAWSIHLGEIVQDISVGQNDTVVTVMANSVNAINVKTGEAIWTLQLSSSSNPYPAFVKNDNVFLLTDDSFLALNIQDGKILWQQSCECYYSKILDVSDKYILINSPSDRLYAYSTGTGSQLWFLPVGRGFIGAYIDGDLIYKIDNELDAVDAKTGELIWSNPLDIKGNSVFSNGKLFYEGGNSFLPNNTYIVAFDVNKRTELWRKHLNTQHISDFFINDKSLYVSDPNRIFLFSVDNGNLIWAANSSEPTNIVAVENKLYALGEFSRTISEFDVSSGKQKNDIQMDLPQLIRTEAQDMIVTENILLFLKGKNIYAYTHE